MKSIHFTILTLLVMGIPVLASDIPPLPKLALFKPTFLELNSSWSAGTAFSLKVPRKDEQVLVMPDHLFGPAGGQDTQMTPDDIAEQVRAVVGLSMQDKRTVIVAGPYLKIADAHPLDETGVDKDLAVFPLRTKQEANAFELADRSPERDDRVYMFARLRGESEPKLLPGTVIRSSDTELVYLFESSVFDAAGTSGAPILNSDGKVVGMNVGGTESNGKQYGFANPAAAIRKELATARRNYR